MSLIETGLQVVHQAVDYDTKGQYVEAVRHYDIAVSYFEEALKAEPNPASRAQLAAKIGEYKLRANTLRPMLPPVSPVISNPASLLPASGYGLPQPAPSPEAPASFFSSAPSLSPAPAHGSHSISPHPYQQLSFSSPVMPAQASPQPGPSPAPASSPASSPAPPVCHPMIMEYAQRYPRDQPNLQAALDIAEMAKSEDKANHMQAALDLYTEVLERFLLCYNAETNSRIRESLRETISSYMTRAEKIKESFKISPTPVPQIHFSPPPPPINPSATILGSFGAPPHFNSSPHLSGSSPHFSGSSPHFSGSSAHASAFSPSPFSPADAPSDFNMSKSRSRVKPGHGISITVSNQTKSLLGRKPLHFTVTLGNSQATCGTKAVLRVEVINESTMVVDYIKVTLRSNTRKAVTDNKGRNVMDEQKEIVRREEFYQGSIFPLQAESNYKGELHFAIPPNLPATNLQHSGFFERDYELKVECILPLRSNLPVYLPIVIDG